MLTLEIENKSVENIFINEFKSNKEKFFEFIEDSFVNMKNTSNDLSHLTGQIEDGMNSSLSSKSHKEIFEELKSKYV